MVKYGQKQSIMVKNGQLRSKTVNFSQKQSIMVTNCKKNRQLRSEPVNYVKTKQQQKRSITVKIGKLQSKTVNYCKKKKPCQLGSERVNYGKITVKYGQKRSITVTKMVN